MLPGTERGEGELEVCDRRGGHQHEIDGGVLDGGGVRTEMPRSAVLLAELRRALGIAARVVAGHTGEAPQGTAVETGREPTAEERDAEIGHQARANAVPTPSALAAMVRLGFTPALPGEALPSVTQRFSIPCRRQNRSTADVRGSSPIRAVPTACEKVLTFQVMLKTEPACRSTWRARRTSARRADRSRGV